MFVKYIDGDVRPIADPTDVQIEDAIRRLDGQQATLVSLEADDEARMWISGGDKQRYICTVTFDGSQCYNLVDPTQNKQSVSLVAGGQVGDYSGRLVVELDLVLRAAQKFSVDGVLAEELSWERAP